MPKHPPRVAPTATLADPDLPDGIAPAAAPAEKLTCNGIELSVRHTEPSGTDTAPALMVHGLGGSALNWTDLAYLLRGRLDTVAIDLPGHGRSGPAPDLDYTLTGHARTVIAYLEDSGRGPVHLFGNSMGGAISILVAAQRPDLVRTLTLVSPAVPDVKRLRNHALRNDPRLILMAIPGVGERGLKRAALKIPVEKRIGMTLDVCFVDRSRYPQQRFADDVAQATERMSMPWADDAFLRSMRGMAKRKAAASVGMWEAMRMITAPTLVIWGDHDKLVAPDLLGFVAAAVPDSRQLMLAGVGHTAQMEDPRTVARAFAAMSAAVAP